MNINLTYYFGGYDEDEFEVEYNLDEYISTLTNEQKLQIIKDIYNRLNEEQKQKYRESYKDIEINLNTDDDVNNLTTGVFDSSEYEFDYDEEIDDLLSNYNVKWFDVFDYDEVKNYFWNEYSDDIVNDYESAKWYDAHKYDHSRDW